MHYCGQGLLTQVLNLVLNIPKHDEGRSNLGTIELV